jgi:hypothetical protein
VAPAPFPQGDAATYDPSYMAEWWSIEVLHGEFSAFQWQQSYDSELIEAALTNGALDGTWHAGEWGVAFEVCFSTAAEWEAFRSLPVVRAALDAVPDPVNGLLIYRGRGGTSASGKPRRPRPAPAAGAMALPEPEDETFLDLTGAAPPELVGAAAISPNTRRASDPVPYKNFPIPPAMSMDAPAI